MEAIRSEEEELSAYVAVKEERLFLDAPIKIEYPDDSVEIKDCTLDSGSSEVPPNSSLLDNVSVTRTNQELDKASVYTVKEEINQIQIKEEKHDEGTREVYPVEGIFGWDPSDDDDDDDDDEGHQPSQDGSTSLSEECYPLVVCKPACTERRRLQTFSPKGRGPVEGDRDRDQCEKPFKCDLCDKRFTQQWSLKNHQIIHSGGKPYKCDICDAEYFYEKSFKKHMRVHVGVKPFKCDQCKKGFVCQSMLDAHKLTTHTGSLKKRRCKHCDMRFCLISDLDAHLQSHPVEKPFKCNQCEKRFKLKESLKNHQLIHPPEQPFQCDQCEKKFSVERRLRYHLQTHAVIEKLECEQCKWKFDTKSKFLRHRCSHTADKPIKCEFTHK